MKNNTLRIATRKSPLAMWQASYVKHILEAIHPELSVELISMLTEGDIKLEASLAEVGGKGLFLKELEKALLADEADIAVHSIKDMPAELPDGLCLSVICPREDPRDVLVSNKFSSIGALPKNAVIGTSSLRRQFQLLALRSDLTIKPLRGNVGTRLKKLDDGEYDALILAAAGLKRLNEMQRITAYLSTDIFLPAVGQGAIGIESRMGDDVILEKINVLNDPETRCTVLAERAFIERLGGGCHMPVAAYATVSKNVLQLCGAVGTNDGKKVIKGEQQSDVKNPEALGRLLAEDLLEKGADEILALFQQ